MPHAPRSSTNRLTRLLIFIVLFTAGSLPARSEDKIHIWVKGFIPNKHPTNPSYIKAIPGQTGKWMIPGPAMDSACYATDHRQFSSDPKAHARCTTEFVVIFDGTTASIEKADGRDIHRCDPSEKIDCMTGNTVATKIATPAVRLTGEPFRIGGPHISNGMVQVIFQASAVNPFAPAGVSPSIDYSLDLTYNITTKKVIYKGTIGRFPAYEAYVSVNGQEPRKLFAEAPTGASAWALYEFGTGIGDRPVNGEIQINP
jgi:hypothetical protein